MVKKGPTKNLVWEIGLPKGDSHAHLDQFGIIQNLQMSPIPVTSSFVGTFFTISYSKPALV